MTSKNTPSHGGCCQGLTIIELLVVVSIAAILATLAAPFLRDFVVRNKLAGLSNEFTASVLRARNEAVTRNACVTMCMVADYKAKNLSCASSGNDWQAGWMVFMNAGCDASLDQPADGTLVHLHLPDDASYAIRSVDSTPDRKLFFDPRGNPRANDRGRFDVAYGSSPYPANRTICLDRLGHTRVIKPTDPSC